MATGGLQGRQNLLQGVLAATKGMKDGARTKALWEDAWPIAEKGYEAARLTIMNTPSAIVDKPNRRWTDQMLNAVDHDAKQSGTTTTARAGWIALKRNYFLIQDGGGMGTGDFAGIYITPMHALRNAKNAMTKEAKKRGYQIQ